jgi:hypothetical protein
VTGPVAGIYTYTMTFKPRCGSGSQPLTLSNTGGITGWDGTLTNNTDTVKVGTKNSYVAAMNVILKNGASTLCTATVDDGT